jgi:SAM-dependent methyltransferase
MEHLRGGVRTWTHLEPTVRTPLPSALKDATRDLVDAARRVHDAHPGERPDARRQRLERAVAAVVDAARDLEETDPPQRVRQAQLAFRREARGILGQSWIMHRSLTKPRGFAGDHLLLDAFYTRRTAGTPVGRMLDELVLACAAGRAVVDRKRFVAGWIAERARRGGTLVADIACGPCRLERDVLDGSAGREIRFLAMDGDDQALAYAHDVLEDDPRVQLWHENAIRIARDPYAAAPLAGADLLVSLGLFDYLPDRIAIRLLRVLSRAMRPGGEMLVGNFAADNPSRLFMEWFGDWPLIHRSEDAFVSLFEQAGLARDRLTVEREGAGGVVLLVTARTGAVDLDAVIPSRRGAAVA